MSARNGYGHDARTGSSRRQKKGADSRRDDDTTGLTGEDWVAIRPWLDPGDWPGVRPFPEMGGA